MLQLLELLVAQQQQNVGLQSRVEELSQQVVSLKGNAADSETAQAADAVQAATAATVSLVQQIQVEGPAGSKAAADKTASSAEQSPPLPDARVADAPVAAQPQASTPLAAAQPPAAATADAPHSQRPASTTPGKALKPQNGQGKRDRQGKKDEKDKKDTKDRRDRQTQGRGRERGAVKVVPEDVRVLGRLEELRRQSDALVKALQARGALGGQGSMT